VRRVSRIVTIGEDSARIAIAKRLAISERLMRTDGRAARQDTENRAIRGKGRGE